MPSTNKTPWDIEDPSQPLKRPEIYSETGRWLALLNSPIKLLRDPLRFGALSVNGYFVARRDWSLREHSGWPRDPLDIARVLKIAGVKADEAGMVAMLHRNYIVSTKNNSYADLFALHLAILNELDVRPTYKDLLDALNHVEWRKDVEVQDFANSFEVMRYYLDSPAEEEAFLNAWLKDFKNPQQERNFENSMGVVLASRFTRAHPQVLINWCERNDDPAGLAYLTWQNRIPLSSWLEKAFTEPDQVGMRGSDTSEEDLWLRREEILEGLALLKQRLPSENIREAVALFSSQNSDLLNQAITLFDDAKRDTRLKWIFTLLDFGLINKDHDVVVEIFDQLERTQTIMLDDLVNGDTHDDDIMRHGLSSYLHALAGPIAMKISEKARQLIVNDMILQTTKAQLAHHVQAMKDKSWFTGVSMQRAILSRVAAGFSQPADLIAPLYPFMNLEDKQHLAKKMMEYTLRGRVFVAEAVNNMRLVAPKMFKDVDFDKHNGPMFMAHALTLVDPAPIFDTIESLDIKEKDPLFLDMLNQWIDQQIPLGDKLLPQVVMPNDVGDELLGYE